MAVGQAGIQTFSIEGNEISAYVNTLHIYESLCKPYLTAKAIIIDDNRIIDELLLVGGENVSFEIIAEGQPAKTYSATLQIYSIKKDQSSINKRAQVYEMDLFGSEYFGDRINLVEKAYDNKTGTDIIRNIHSEFVGGSLQIPVESLGLLYQQNFLNINATKPFKAIDDMRRQITFAQYPTGINVYYHDKTSAVLAPVEHLFENLSGPTYKQKATWGANYSDIFSGESTHAIIDAVTSIDMIGNSSRTTVHDVTATEKQELKVLDANSNKTIINRPATKVSEPKIAGTPFSGLADAIMGRIMGSQHGGKQNFRKVDTQKTPPAAVRQTDKEQLYKAMLANAVQIYIKVPIQGGLDATVGKGVVLELLPPIGADQTTSTDQKSILSGPALVADIEHTIHNDNMLSSTTMRVVKGGFNS